MKRIWIWAVLTGAAAGAGVQAEPEGYRGPGFSATRVETVGGDSETSTIYLSRHGMREESGPAGHRLVIISNLDSGKTWVMDQKHRVYQSLAQATAAAGDRRDAEADTLLDPRPCMGFDLTRRLGQEKVAGRLTQKWVCGNSRTRREVMQWFDPGLKLVIRERTPHGRQVELRDIRLAEPRAELFRLPAGYREGKVGRR